MVEITLEAIHICHEVKRAAMTGAQESQYSYKGISLGLIYARLSIVLQ